MRARIPVQMQPASIRLLARLSDAKVLNLLQLLHLNPDSHDPMIPLRATSRLEHHTSPWHTKLTNKLKPTPRPTILLIRTARPKQTPPPPMPDNKASHVVLVGAGPAVFEVDAGQGVVARFAAVEGAVAVQQVVLRQQAAVQVAVLEVERVGAFVVDVRDLFACARAERVLEDEHPAVAEDYGAAGEGSVAAGFAVEYA